jgi:hypothetical protein
MRIGLAVAVGAAASAAILMAVIGARPNLTAAMTLTSFWLKVAYTALTAAVALSLVARMARPGARLNILWLAAIPPLLYSPIALWELINTQPSDWLPLLLGYGWRQCTWLMVALSIPVYIGLLWAFRTFAPTNIDAAGAMAGLGASGVAAVIYCLHCPTDTAVFALAWYTLAFVLAAILGALVGRHFLRW